MPLTSRRLGAFSRSWLLRVPPSTPALLFLISVGMSVFTGIAGRAAEWEGRVEVVDGVEHVYNPDEPMLGDQVLVPRPLFRIEGEGEEYLLGAVSRVLCDEAGDTYLLDAQLDCIWVFDAQGRFLRSIGRQGEAPGEWTRAYDMCLLPGNRLAVVQMMPSRLVTLARGGEPLDDHPLPEVADGGVRMLMDAECRNSNLVLELVTPFFDGKAQTDRARVIGVTREGEERCLYGEATTITGVETVVIGRDREGIPEAWTLGPDGILYAAPAHREYRIESFDRMARPLRVIDREYETLPLADEDTLAEHDVFDPMGRYLCRVKVEVDYDFEEDSPVIVGDRLYIKRNVKGAWASMFAGSGIENLGDVDSEPDGDLEFSIVCYRLPFVCASTSN